MKTTKNVMRVLAISVIAIFVIAIMANCVSAKWSYEKADPTTKEHFDKIKQGFVNGNDKAKIKAEWPSNKGIKGSGFQAGVEWTDSNGKHRVGNLRVDKVTDIGGDRRFNVNGKPSVTSGTHWSLSCDGRPYAEGIIDDNGYSHKATPKSENIKAATAAADEAMDNSLKNAGVPQAKDDPKKPGGSNKKEGKSGKGKSSTSKSKVSVAKVINGFGGRIGGQVGGINFTEIHGSVEGKYSDLRYVDFENLNFLSKESEGQFDFSSLELLLTAIIFPNENLWISIEQNGTVLENDELRNTSIGWILFNADASLKRIYYFEYDEVLGKEIQNNCNGGEFIGRFWISPGYVNAYVERNNIFIKNSSMKVSFELLNASNNCVNNTVTSFVNGDVLPNMSYWINNDIVPQINDTLTGKKDIQQSFRDLRNAYNSIAIAQWLKKKGLVTEEDAGEYLSSIQDTKTYYLHQNVVIPNKGGTIAVPEEIYVPYFVNISEYDVDEGLVEISHVFGGIIFENISINEIPTPSDFKQNITKSVIDAWNSSSGIITFENKNYALDGIKLIYIEQNVSVLTMGDTVKFNISGNYITAKNVTFTIDGFEFVSAMPSPKIFYYEYNSEIQGNTLKVIWDVNNSKINYTITLKANSTRYLKYSVIANETNGVLEYNDSIKVLPVCQNHPMDLYDIWPEMYGDWNLQVYIPLINESVIADSDLILRLPIYIINNGTEDYDITIKISSSNDSSSFIDTLLPSESFNYTSWLWFDNSENCNEYRDITICLNASTETSTYQTNCMTLSNYVIVTKPPQPTNTSVSYSPTITGNVLNSNISFTNVGCSNGTFEIYAFTNDSYLEVTPYEVNVSDQSQKVFPLSINLTNLTGVINITVVIESYEGFYDYKTFTLNITKSAVPDLIIANLTPSKTSPFVNESITFTVVTKNTGNLSTINSSYTYYYLGTTYIGNISVSVLDINAAQTNNFTWTCPSTGTYTIKAKADATNRVSEGNEANNEKAYNLTCY